MKTRLRVTAAVLMVGTLFLGACGGLNESRADGSLNRPGASGSGPDAPVSTTNPSPAPPPVEPSPLAVEPRSDLVDPFPVDWTDVHVIDDRTIGITFYGGVEDCYGVHHVDVTYGPDAVTVSLFEGRVPTAEACIEIAVLKALTIELDGPLAGRDVLDGAEQG